MLHRCGSLDGFQPFEIEQTDCHSPCYKQKDLRSNHCEENALPSTGSASNMWLLDTKEFSSTIPGQSV